MPIPTPTTQESLKLFWSYFIYLVATMEANQRQADKRPDHLQCLIFMGGPHLHTGPEWFAACSSSLTQPACLGVGSLPGTKY